MPQWSRWQKSDTISFPNAQLVAQAEAQFHSNTVNTEVGIQSKPLKVQDNEQVG